MQKWFPGIIKTLKRWRSWANPVQTFVKIVSIVDNCSDFFKSEVQKLQGCHNTARLNHTGQWIHVVFSHQEWNSVWWKNKYRSIRFAAKCRMGKWLATQSNELHWVLLMPHNRTSWRKKKGEQLIRVKSQNPTTVILNYYLKQSHYSFNSWRRFWNSPRFISSPTIGVPKYWNNTETATGRFTV